MRIVEVVTDEVHLVGGSECVRFLPLAVALSACHFAPRQFSPSTLASFCEERGARSEATNGRLLIMNEGGVMILLSLRSSRRPPSPLRPVFANDQ